MAHEVEQTDGEKVDEALKHLKNGNITEAATILLDVCSRCPDDYQYEYVEANTRYIKFWDVTEFLGYATKHKQSENKKQTVVWIPSAYPRACYHLAFILVEKRDFLGAMEWLAKGQSMEPQNPKFFLESGVAYAHMKEYQRSLDCYQQAVKLPGISQHERAVALRGMGVQLIDLRRLDEAETRLKESLELEADNVNAKYELTFISQLRTRQRPYGAPKS